MSLPSTSHSTGVIYVATGKSFVDEAIRSARSVKKHSPELPITLFSDINPQMKDPCFDTIELIDNAQYGFIDKIAAMGQSRFDRTLFLDTDTIALGPLEDAFALLDRFDLAVAHEPARYLYPIGSVPSIFAELNTGVVLYRKTEAFLNLVEHWLESYKAELAACRQDKRPSWHDQLSFTQAVWDSSLSLYILPPEWNYRAPFPQFLCGKVSVFHGRMKNQSTSLEFVNRETTGRLLNPNPGRLLSIISDTWKLFSTLKRN